MIGYDNCRTTLARKLQRRNAVFREIDDEPGFIQKERLELTHVRVAFDNKNQCTRFVSIHGFAITARPTKGVEVQATRHACMIGRRPPVHDRHAPGTPEPSLGCATRALIR